MKYERNRKQVSITLTDDARNHLRSLSVVTRTNMSQVVDNLLAGLTASDYRRITSANQRRLAEAQEEGTS